MLSATVARPVPATSPTFWPVELSPITGPRNGMYWRIKTLTSGEIPTSIVT